MVRLGRDASAATVADARAAIDNLGVE